MSIDETLKDFLSKGAKASKNALSIAGSAVQDFSDKSVIKIEIKKLEAKKTKKITALGSFVFDTLKSEEKKTISLKNEEMQNFFDEITGIEKQIEDKNKLLEEVENKEE